MFKKKFSLRFLVFFLMPLASICLTVGVNRHAALQQFPVARKKIRPRLHHWGTHALEPELLEFSRDRFGMDWVDCGMTLVRQGRHDACSLLMSDEDHNQFPVLLVDLRVLVWGRLQADMLYVEGLEPYVQELQDELLEIDGLHTTRRPATVVELADRCHDYYGTLNLRRFVKVWNAKKQHDSAR